MLRARKVCCTVLTADIISSVYPVEQDNCRHDLLLVTVTPPEPQCQVMGREDVKVSPEPYNPSLMIFSIICICRLCWRPSKGLAIL